MTDNPSALAAELELFDAEQIAGRLERLDVKATLREAFAELAQGSAVQPPQSLVLLPEEAGDFIVYMGALGAKGVFGAKISPFLSSLAKSGKPPVTVSTLLFSIATGRPALLCDSLALTTERTAATTSLALDYLAPEVTRRLGVIGAGNLARRHIALERQARTWEEVRVFSPALVAGNEDRRARLEAACPGVEIVADAEAAVRGADVVMLCTSSGTPVIDAAWLGESVTVTSISTNVAQAHEIAPAALAGFHVFCDYRATCPLSAGEMVLARQYHGWDPAGIVADLPELVAGKSDLPKARRFFRSIGLGLEDIAVASLLLD